MKYIDVFDKKGEWLGTEVFLDTYPDELVLTSIRTEFTYPPDIWVQASHLTDAGCYPARIEHTPSLREGLCCSFCGKHKDEVPSLVESAVDASKAICGTCIKKLGGHK